MIDKLNPNIDKLVDAAEWFLAYEDVPGENATVVIKFRRNQDRQQITVVEFEDHDQEYRDDPI